MAWHWCYREVFDGGSGDDRRWRATMMAGDGVVAIADGDAPNWRGRRGRDRGKGAGTGRKR
ncbi:hypothetical protein E2562_004110 [Oryza meyeriana var. granulata]|uniref:Uncharacterized protein n=1 Tax=Oryza meyeriana var. granulata TaxID=110450 RepID=A0A6G1EV07_9ORYZ|nr:hypothetical protein E2562_004110 [Oryza meyeriana var. granulata]